MKHHAFQSHHSKSPSAAAPTKADFPLERIQSEQRLPHTIKASKGKKSHLINILKKITQPGKAS